MTYRDILKRANTDQINKLGRYVDKVKNKLLNKSGVNVYQKYQMMMGRHCGSQVLTGR